MHKRGAACDCESCRAVRQLWADAANSETEEKLLLDHNGEVSFSERTKAVIRAHRKEVSLYFDERNEMHQGAVSVEEEFGNWMRQVEAGNADVEIRELRTDSDELKRFEVTVKNPQLEDAAQTTPDPK